MACFRRRRYDPRYGYRYRPRPVGGSCLRDACLIDAGCCLGESLSGDCLILTVLALPQLTAALLAEPGPSGGRGLRQTRNLPRCWSPASERINVRSVPVGARVVTSHQPVRSTRHRRCRPTALGGELAHHQAAESLSTPQAHGQRSSATAASVLARTIGHRVRSIQLPQSGHRLAPLDPPGRPGAAPRRIDRQVPACAFTRLIS